MKKSGISLLACCLLVMTSCHNRQLTDAIQEIMPVDSIELELGQQDDIFIYDGKLFTIDSKTIDNNFVQVYDLSTKQFLFSFGPKGPGPSEFGENTVSHIDFYERDGKQLVEVYEFNTKLATYSYESLMRDKSAAKPMLVRRVHEITTDILKVLKTDDGYITTGFHPEGKYLFLNDSLEVSGYAGDYRPKPNESYDDFVHFMANYGALGMSADRHYLAECITIAPIMTLYELKNHSLVKMWENVKQEIDYVPTSEASFADKSEHGYISATITDRFVYGLLMGEPEDDEIGHYEREVHVFDIHTGEIVQKYLLDRPSRKILVHGGKLYVLTHYPEPTILIYNQM